MGQGRISSCQVLVVDDGSSDDTPALLRKFPWVETVRMDSQCGYGAALKLGFQKSSGDWIAFLDLDGTYDPLDLGTLIHELEDSRADFLLGERFSLGRGMPLARHLGNRFFTWMVRGLYRYPIQDACTGYRVFRRNCLNEILNIPHTGLDYSLAMTLWAVKKRVPLREVPVRYHSRTGESKLSIVGDGSRFLWTILSGHFGYSRTR